MIFNEFTGIPRGQREPKRRRMLSSPTRSASSQNGDCNSTRTGGLSDAISESSGDESPDHDRSVLSDSQKLDVIIQKLNDMEDKLAGKIFDIEKNIDELPTKDDIKSLEDKIDDQENRMRRYYIIIYNVPEKAGGSDCADFVKDFIMNHMGIEADSTGMNKWEIERAHCSLTQPQQNRTTPRLVFV